MTDYTVGDTLHIAFTTRAFATGIPTVLAGTPVVSAYEDADLTQITAGITLGVDHDTVVGLNMLTIVATGANGFETGKDYNLVITTGTVGGVSVVGEVVGRFTLGRSAAAVDLANGTDGLGAIKTDTAATLVDTAVIGALGAGLTDLGGMSTGMKAEVNAEADTALTDYDAVVPADLPTNFADLSITVTTGLVTLAAVTHTGALIPTVTTVTTLTGHTAQTGDSFARLGAAGAGLTDLGGMSTGMKAEVNVEALDVLNTDTLTLPGQVAPPLTPTHREAIAWLYKVFRNRKTQTASQWSLLANDETTVDAKATVSDDATTATKQEVVTGP